MKHRWLTVLWHARLASVLLLLVVVSAAVCATAPRAVADGNWDGQFGATSALGQGTYVQALASSGGNVYIGGSFSSAGGVAVNNIAKWNGTSWSTLGTGAGVPFDYVSAILVDGANVYVGGNFTTAGGVTVNNIAKWDGSSWSALGSGVNHSVSALAMIGTNLYVGGFFTTAGGIPANNIARWDGSSWSALGTGVGEYSTGVFAFLVNGTNLYVGGVFTTAGGIPANNIARWDGSSWSALGSGVNNGVQALAMSGTNLYVGGEFTTAGGSAAQNIAIWDGNNWSALAAEPDAYVTALTFNGTNLFACGQFTHAGGLPVNYTAKWDGGNWSPLGSGLDNTAATLATDSNFLYVGGNFVQAGGNRSRGIARWGLTGSGGGGSSTNQAQLSIRATVSSSSDTNGVTARIGDTLTYTLTFANSGTATAKNLQVQMFIPKFTDVNGLLQQFATSNVTVSAGGTFVDAAAPGGGTAKAIRWSVGDLAGGFQQFVRFTIKLVNTVNVPSTIVYNNNYSIQSTVSQPSGVADAASSGAPTISVDVRGPLSITAVASPAQVTPGGVFSYQFAVTNFAGTLVKNVAVVVDVPQFCRFVSASIPGNKTAKYVLVRHISDPSQNSSLPDQVLIYLPSLAAHGSPTGKDSQLITVTLQAQWIDPADVQGQLSTIDYGVAVLNLTDLTPYSAALAKPSTNDFMAFLRTSANTLAASFNDSGPVTVAFHGSLTNQPSLLLLKPIYDNPATTLDDLHSVDDGAGGVNTIAPGGEISFALIAKNTGASPAEDVAITDQLPEGMQLVLPGNKPTVLTSASKPTDLNKAVPFTTNTVSAALSAKTKFVTLSPDGRTLHIGGLHLEPHGAILLFYSAQLRTDAGAPAVGQTISSGSPTIVSSSTPHEWFGVPASIPLLVQGTPSLDIIFGPAPLVTRPGHSTNVADTANALTAIFNSQPSALPLVAAANPTMPKTYVPGFQRYYLAYQNTGKLAVNDAKIHWPVPANTAFYRTKVVAPDGTLQDPVFSMTTPAFLSTNGIVTYTIGNLKAGQSGALMLEVIITDNAITPNGSLVTASQPVIYTGAAPSSLSSQALHPALQSAGPFDWLFGKSAPKQNSAALSVTPVADPALVPQLGIAKIVPNNVVPGSNFNMTLVMFNLGNNPAIDPSLVFTIPPGSSFVSATFPNGNGEIDFSPPHSRGPGTFVTVRLTSNNGPLPPSGNEYYLNPHTAAGVTITLQAPSTGLLFTDSSAAVASAYSGARYAPRSVSTLASGSSLLGATATGKQTIVAGADFVALHDDNGTVVIPIGGGNIVASGAGNLITQDGGTLISQDGGTIIASGAGNLISVGTVSGLGDTTGSGVLAGVAALIAAGGGNIYNLGAGNLITQDGGTVISNDGGSILATVASLIASGAGNIIASGGGNLITQDGGTIGNIFTCGGAILDSGGGSFAISLANSSALVASGGGNIVSAGAGNLVTTSGGAVIAP